MSLTIAQMSQYIGQTKRYEVKKGISFDVTIEDIRQSFGRTDALIKPVAGRGTMWVSLDTLG